MMKITLEQRYEVADELHTLSMDFVRVVSFFGSGGFSSEEEVLAVVDKLPKQVRECFEKLQEDKVQKEGSIPEED